MNENGKNVCALYNDINVNQTMGTTTKKTSQQQQNIYKIAIKMHSGNCNDDIGVIKITVNFR